jgi:ribosomal protein L11 methyltransferase
MKNYKEILIQVNDDSLADLYIGLLSNIGFDGFEQTETELKGYIDAADFEEKNLEEIATQNNFTYQLQEIEEQNWNALWESNFEPIQVDDFVGIRADFHDPIENVQHEIRITPKMSFGTGHHATTYMMIAQMQNLDFQGKKVLDFGTGTGILAILAEKLGAKNIIAIDNDPWSIDNTEENVEKNNCKNIEVQLASSIANFDTESFDIILANINRNIILDNWEDLDKKVKKDGFILLSGLLAEDETTIQEKADQSGWKHLNTVARRQWISILYQK